MNFGRFSAGVTFGGFAAAMVLRSHNHNNNKSKTGVGVGVRWRRVGRVERITIFPLKSGRAVNVTSATFTPLGLKCGLLRDRSFCVVNAET